MMFDHITKEDVTRSISEAQAQLGLEPEAPLMGLADSLANILNLPAIARPQPTTVAPTRLTRVWADCVICGHALGVCECDPDDYAAALLAARRAA